MENVPEETTAENFGVMTLGDILQGMEGCNEIDGDRPVNVQTDNITSLGDHAQSAGNKLYVSDSKTSESITNHSNQSKVPYDKINKLCVIKTDQKTRKTLVAMNNKNRPVSRDCGRIVEDVKGHVSNLSDDGNIFFQCITCNTMYSSLAELQAHIPQHYTFNGRDKKDSCHVCHYHLNQLNDHFATCHCNNAQQKTAPIQINATEYSHAGKGYVCDLCGSKFDAKAAMLNHRNKHKLDSKTHQCALCPKKYQTKRTLQLHLFQCHRVGKAYACPKCDKVFSVPSLLQQHIYSHGAEKPFNCDICGKTYQTENLLKRHKATHNKRFECSHCDRLFKCQLQLTRHLNALNNVFEAECQECGKKFTSNYYLQSHMVTHRSNKDYQCTWCGAMFARKSQLKRHTLVHTGEREHTCKLCSKSFVTVNSLNKHRRLHIGQKTPFSCEKCGKKFGNEASAKQHYCRYTQVGVGKESNDVTNVAHSEET